LNSAHGSGREQNTLSISCDETNFMASFHLESQRKLKNIWKIVHQLGSSQNLCDAANTIVGRNLIILYIVQVMRMKRNDESN
ncbi:hypothetical protein ACQP3C_29315, partial [Escherichia coli]